MTFLMSRADIPTLSWVLPAYYDIKKGLLNAVRDTEDARPLSLKNAAAGALERLEKYLKFASTSHSYLIATGGCLM